MEYYLVDKFNRGYYADSKVSAVQSGDGLEIIGNTLNAKKRKIINLTDGENHGDAATINQLDAIAAALVNHDNRLAAFSATKSYFSVQNKRIVSVGKGVDPKDAVNKSQVDALESKIETVIKQVGTESKKLKTDFEALKAKVK